MSSPWWCPHGSNQSEPKEKHKRQEIRLKNWLCGLRKWENTCTFPRRPLCFDSRPPPFFTATSRVRLWSSTRETLNSNLNTEQQLKPIEPAFSSQVYQTTTTTVWLTNDQKLGGGFSSSCEFSSCPTSVCQGAGRGGRRGRSRDPWTLSSFCEGT